MYAIAVLVLLLAAATASDASSGHKPSPKCPPAHSHVLRTDRQAVVYTIGEHYVEQIEGVHGPIHVVVPVVGIRGCVQGQRRSYKLGEPPKSSGGGAARSFGGIAHEVLGGTMVAYEEFSGAANFEGLTEASWLVKVRDLRSGRMVHEVPTGTREKVEPAFAGVGRAAGIVVKSDGAVAWIAENYERSGATKYFEVHAADKTGSRLLAAGPDIDLRSLALRGNTLHWKQGGRTSSASLN